MTKPFINLFNQLEFSLIDLNLRKIENQPKDQRSLDFIHQLISNYCHGHWHSILKDPKVLNYFKFNIISNNSPPISITNHSNYPQDHQLESITKLSIIATLLSVYVQINFTGPIFPFDPLDLFLPQSEEDHLPISETQLNSKSLDQLSLAGEPAYHLTKSASFLLMAILLIDQLSSSSSLTTLPWWKLRAGILQRRLFDEPVPLPDHLPIHLDQLQHSLLVPLHQSALTTALDSQNQQIQCWNQDLLPMLTLERGLAEHITGNEKGANRLFRKAVSEAKLEYQLTGIPGKRTKFQEKEFSQLVVLAQSRNRDGWMKKDDDATATDQSEVPLSSESKSTTTNPSCSSMPITLALNDDTLMEKTQFTQSADSPLAVDPSNQPTLHPLDQALLLALSLSIKNTSPSHGLTKAQMAPFIERVLENPLNWSVHSMALLVRSRLESHRTRTVERGLLQLQALVDQLTKDAENDPVDKSTGSERVRWTWSLALPSKWELERELAQKFSGLGVTRSALEIFERLEMWEHVVQCHINLGSKALGISLVKELIEDKKIESSLKMTRSRSTRDGKRLGKLWCLLAELESDPKHWETAWEVSQHTSSRAMRSLGAHHFMIGNYSKAKEYLLLGLKINPLFTKTWFVYGCAAMKTSDWDEAEVAFRRCVSLDDEDAEAWNNLATVHLKKATLLDAESKEESEQDDSTSIKPLLTDEEPDIPGDKLEDEDEDDLNDRESKRTLSRPMAAFYALQQAAKLSYDSWKIYENYMIIGMSVGEYSEATRALGRLVEIRGEEGLDTAVLRQLVEVIRRQRSREGDEQQGSDKHSRLLERLADVMDRVIVVKCANEPFVWEVRADLSDLADDPEAGVQHQLSAYRVGVSQRAEEWLNEPKKFQLAAHLLQRTVQRLTARSHHDPRATWQAKSFLKNFLAKAQDPFHADDAFVQLESLYQSLL